MFLSRTVIWFIKNKPKTILKIYNTNGADFPKQALLLRNLYSMKTLLKKEKLLVTSNFSFSHYVLYPYGELYAIFIKLKIVICKLFQCGRVQNLSFGKGLYKPFIMILYRKIGYFYIT